MELVLDKLIDIILIYFSQKWSYGSESIFTRKRISAEIQRSLMQVISEFEPFFVSENISEVKQKILLECCGRELKKVLAEPDIVFKNSINVTKLMESIYPKGSYPQEICDEDLNSLFSVVFSGIMKAVLSYSPVLEAWKLEKYKDDARRFDTIAEGVKNILRELVKTTEANSLNTDKLLTRVKTTLFTQGMFNIEISGLRGERPDAVQMDKCFILPQIELIMNDSHKKTKLQSNQAKQLETLQEMLDTICAANSKNIVYGVPGIGKSTWTRWINMNMLQGSIEIIPILVKCRDTLCKENLPSLIDIIREMVGVHLCDEITPQTLREWIDSHKVIIIFDGFDEVPPGKRDNVSLWIKVLLNSIGSSPVLITSRAITTQHLDQLGSSWKYWSIKSFTQTQIVEYIDKWYRYSPLLTNDSRVVDSVKLASEWMSDATLRPLVSVPLMLTTILMVHHMDGKLPKGRANLYERYINGMLELWDSRSGVVAQTSMTTSQKKDILTQLAIHFHFNEVEVLDDSEMEVFIEAAEKKVKCSCTTAEVLTLLKERTGLLVGPGTWSFIHKNISEFLVAQAVKDGHLVTNNGTRIDRFKLYNERSNDRWSYVLLFWIGLSTISELHDFVNQLVSDDDYTNSGVALEILYDQSDTGRLTEPWYSETLKQLLSHDYFSKKSDNDRIDLNYLAYPSPITDASEISHVNFLYKWQATPLAPTKLLCELISTSTLSIGQVLACHKSILLPVWLGSFDLCREREDYEYLLSQCNEDNPTLWDARAFTYTWFIDNVFCNQQIPVSDYMDILEKAIPSLQGTFTFHLLGYFTKVIHDFKNRLRSYELNKSDYKRLVNEILKLQQYRLSEEWLLLTAKYKFYNDRTNDLLSYSIRSIVDGIREGLLADSDDTATLSAFVEDLMFKRDVMLSDLSNDMVNKSSDVYM